MDLMNLILKMVEIISNLKIFLLFFYCLLGFLVGGMFCRMVLMAQYHLIRLNFIFLLFFLNCEIGFSLIDSFFIFGFQTCFVILVVLFIFNPFQILWNLLYFDQLIIFHFQNYHDLLILRFKILQQLMLDFKTYLFQLTLHFRIYLDWLRLYF